MNFSPEISGTVLMSYYVRLVSARTNIFLLQRYESEAHYFRGRYLPTSTATSKENAKAITKFEAPAATVFYLLRGQLTKRI